MKKELKINLIILTIVIAIILVLSIIDCNRANNGKLPLFSLNVSVSNNGEVKEYLGFGYKIIYFNKTNGYKKIKLGNWFMKPSDFEEEIRLYELAKEKDLKEAIREILGTNSSDYNEDKLFVSCHTRKLEKIPKEFTVQEAINIGCFVYDGREDKIYNEDLLKKFVETTKISSENRISSEITIVIYTETGKPSIYILEYAENYGYILSKDSTRIEQTIDLMEENNPDYKLPEEYSRIVVDTNFPKEYYEVTIKDTGFSSNAICLKSNSKDYQDVEIARYLIKNTDKS